MPNTTNRKVTKYTAPACERLISILVARAMYTRDLTPAGRSALMSKASTWRAWMSVNVHGIAPAFGLVAEARPLCDCGDDHHGPAECPNREVA